MDKTHEDGKGATGEKKIVQKRTRISQLDIPV